MPELPEVQTTVDGLNKKVKKRRITGVWFDAPKLIKRPKPAEFEKLIKGLRIIEAKRLGKNILIYLSGNYLLLVHMKMTGHLLYGKWNVKKVSSNKYKVLSRTSGVLEDRVNDYIHVIFYLDNGYQFALSDLRKFAKVVLGKSEEVEKSSDLIDIGPNPLDKNFTLNKFEERLSGKSGKIKSVLMDQKIISGIGNIYSDEILWSVKIHPLKNVKDLSRKELKDIYHEMLIVLKRAVKLRGTSISDYRDFFGKPGVYADKRLVYRRENQPCPRCGTKIRRIKVGGRSAHYCPICQKA